MRITNYLISTTLILLAHGCATLSPPDELVRARDSYTRAQNSRASDLARDELEKAKKALDSAEKSLEDRDSTQKTIHLSYVAERKAQLAAVVGDMKAAERENVIAQTELAMATESAAGTLAKSRSELEQAKQVASEYQQRMMELLGKIADVRAEARGVVMTLSGNVLFAFNKSELLTPAHSQLSRVADALKTLNYPKLNIEGHTDSIGSAASNLALSQRRADSVRSYLINQGYPADVIDARGMGKEHPIVDNSNAENRANNRRVEIVIQNEGR